MSSGRGRPLFHKHIQPLNGRLFTDQEMGAIRRRDTEAYIKLVRKHAEKVQRELDEIKRKKWTLW